MAAFLRLLRAIFENDDGEETMQEIFPEDDEDDEDDDFEDELRP